MIPGKCRAAQRASKVQAELDALAEAMGGLANAIQHVNDTLARIWHP